MDGWSPLLLAIETRSFHLIKLLIDGGAELDYKGPAGKTALLLATELYLPDIVGYLLCMGSNKAATCNKGWDALIYATRMGSLPMVKLLLDKHCFPDHRDTAGKTALLHAVEVKNRSGIIHSLSGRGPEVIRTLLTYGSDINAKDGIGMNALLYATEDENADTVKILLDHNCKLEHRKPSSGLTAFLIAFNNEDANVALQLLRAGCTVNGSLDDYGVSPLLAAALAGSDSWVHLLIRQDADVRHVDNKGQNVLTFLKHGYEYDYPLISKHFKILFAAGASIEDIDISEMHPDTITKDMIKLSQEKLSLHEQCRRKIRKHLLSPFGGQQNNLYVAVEKLPLPGKMKRHLLFDVPLPSNDQSVSLADNLESLELEWKESYSNLAQFNDEVDINIIQYINYMQRRLAGLHTPQPRLVTINALHSLMQAPTRLIHRVSFPLAQAAGVHTQANQQATRSVVSSRQAVSERVERDPHPRRRDRKQKPRKTFKPPPRPAVKNIKHPRKFNIKQPRKR